MITSADRPTWSVVVPVKGGPAAKSRLHPPRGVSRWSLAYAIAEDCLAAVVGTVGADRVVVVSSDEAVVDLAGTLGAAVVADPGTGLDGAVAIGVQMALDGGGTAVAVLLGDLPALRAQDLRAALAAASERDRSVVPDVDGSGTVLLSVRGRALSDGVPTAFGPGSAAAHQLLGYLRLDLDLPHLRTDVDDDASLLAARHLGLGDATRAVLTLDPPPTLADSRPVRAPRVPD